MSLRSFLKCLLSVLFVVGVMADVTPVSSQSRPDAPRIENFTFTPSTFKHGDRVELSFVYRDVRGGLAGSEVLLYYEGSLFEHTRKPSGFTRKIMRKNKGNDLESGPSETLVKLSTRHSLHEEYGHQPNSFSWQYCDEVLTHSYGGSVILYRTDKSIWRALADITKSDYAYANELEKILKDIRT